MSTENNLMFFNKRGLTDSLLGVVVKPKPHYFSINSFLLNVRSFVPQPTVSLPKILDSGHIISEFMIYCVARGQDDHDLKKLLHPVSEFPYGGNPFAMMLLGYEIAERLSFEHMLLDKRICEHQTNKI
jgi:hypothetical protein